MHGLLCLGLSLLGRERNLLNSKVSSWQALTSDKFNGGNIKLILLEQSITLLMNDLQINLQGNRKNKMILNCMQVEGCLLPFGCSGIVTSFMSSNTFLPRAILSQERSKAVICARWPHSDCLCYS